MHVNAVDALQGVTDIGIGKLAHLVGGHHVGDSHHLFLHLQSLALSVERAYYFHALQFHAILQDEVHHLGPVFRYGQRNDFRLIAHVGNLQLVNAGIKVGQHVETIDVTHHARVQVLDVDRGSGQYLLVAIHHTSCHVSQVCLLGLRVCQCHCWR